MAEKRGEAYGWKNESQKAKITKVESTTLRI